MKNIIVKNIIAYSNLLFPQSVQLHAQFGQAKVIAQLGHLIGVVVPIYMYQDKIDSLTEVCLTPLQWVVGSSRYVTH